MNKSLKEAVIVAYGRSPIGRAVKGSLKNVDTIDLASQILRGVLNKIPQLDAREIDDIIIGCAQPQDAQGWNMARLIALRAGMPYDVSAQTINRLCSSGLQSISTAANMIMVGQADVVVAGGAESMSYIPLLEKQVYENEWLLQNEPGAYIAMGITAENVSKKYGVTRTQMDEMAVESHKRAAEAQDAGKFDKEIIPVEVSDENGNKFMFSKDEGIRRGTSMETLSKLKTIFKENGTVTAGTSSQLSDGAAMVVLMSAEKAKELNIVPIAKFVGFAVAGVEPEIMGIGPINAVPKVMKVTGLSIADMDVIELNEAFAAQAIPCITELGFDTKKVNPNGGAMAMGHPLGSTGTILTCKAISELERTGGRFALITMCIGGGMGAAGIIEKL